MRHLLYTEGNERLGPLGVGETPSLPHARAASSPFGTSGIHASERETG